MAERLRGSPEGLVATIPDAKRIATYGPRIDQTAKGPGYFGEVARTDDPDLYSTELSTTTGIRDPKTGREVLIPLMVPTLTAHEIAHLVDGGDPTLEIVRKAHTFALERLKAGQSPFAGVGEQHPLPLTDEAQFTKGYTQ
jgi:hypothetical protein